MSRKRHTPEQIIFKLREAEVLLSQGQSVPGACKTIEVSEQTYYRWRKEWGGLRLDQGKRFKELEPEKSAQVPPEDIPTLLGKLAQLQGLLWLRLNEGNGKRQAPAGGF